MADIENMELSPASGAIGLSLSTYYQWVNNTAFYAMADPYIFPFYQSWIRVYDFWINGLVPYFHDLSQGLVPTNLARTITEKMADMIIGTGITFENANDEKDNINNGTINEALSFIQKWAKKVKFNEIIKENFEQMAGLGTCALKLNMDNKKELWIENVPMNRGYFDLDAKGDLIKAECYSNIYTRTINKNTENQFGLVEERFYVKENGERKSYAIYRIYQLPAKVNSFIPSPKIEMKGDQLPKWLRECIVNDFGKIRIGEPIKLPFNDLGIYLVKYTPSCHAMPQLKFGDSILANILNYLAQYDYLNAVQVTEMYSGRARVLLPKTMNSNQSNKATNNNFNAGLDTFIYTMYQTLDTSDGKPIFLQPEIRAEQFRALRNILLENIATTIGISPSDFASYLQDNSNRTAREISDEEKSSTLTIGSTRLLVSYPINDLLKTVLLFNGYMDDVCIEFSKAGQSNFSVLVDNIVRLYSTGLISKENAITMLNAGKDQFQINEEMQKIKKDDMEKEQRQANMQFGMDFSNQTNFGGGG